MHTRCLLAGGCEWLATRDTVAAHFASQSGAGREVDSLFGKATTQNMFTLCLLAGCGLATLKA